MTMMVLILIFFVDVDDDYDEEDSLEAETGFVEPPSHECFTIFLLMLFLLLIPRLNPCSKLSTKLLERLPFTNVILENYCGPRL